MTDLSSRRGFKDFPSMWSGGVTCAISNSVGAMSIIPTRLLILDRANV